MCKLIVSIMALSSLAACAQTSALSNHDAGTYVALDSNHRPTQAFYRMQRCDHGWVMDSKLPHINWRNVNCNNGVSYQESTKEEMAFYFSDAWRSKNTATCVRSRSYAFCRYHPKGKPAKTAHVMLLLFTNGAIIRPLQRVHAP